MCKKHMCCEVEKPAAYQVEKSLPSSLLILPDPLRHAFLLNFHCRYAMRTALVLGFSFFVALVFGQNADSLVVARRRTASK